jgi:2-polyprenyl-3-methyl-5-hydroxy-6-metoxy-1,4-benzoquinol methylase
MKQIFDFISGKNVKTILDIGTGSGDFVKVLASLFSEAQITGIDPDEKSIETAAKTIISSEVKFIQMSAEHLRFPDEAFDMVTISNALHHLPDRLVVFEEMKRVVKLDGFLLISELYSDNLNPAQEVQKFYHHTRSSVDRLLGRYHHETWTRAEIIEMVREYGIEISGIFDYKRSGNLIKNVEDLESWVEKMKLIVDQVKNLPEYDTLLPSITEFREMAETHGFQPATNVVIIGRK